ncbi:hypothetical protein RHSIM_Rhsim06G0111900 [Rhododendron simsii]|uniref:Translation initiation factor IF2/IF5 domain-containing protein n=1 Tax=Rhododendron simsii TaxID=118357 RepID=A0A834H1Z5_RHOSS|nr:hypothetical protein RHSIM_Rhsim06G0111900 [Rhododendron simsii]
MVADFEVIIPVRLNFKVQNDTLSDENENVADDLDAVNCVSFYYFCWCSRMHRQPEHVMTFLLAELGTSGSLDGLQRLVVKGRFAPKIFEGILRRYGNGYVICNGCKSPDTILSKENQLFFLRCEKVLVFKYLYVCKAMVLYIKTSS